MIIISALPCVYLLLHISFYPLAGRESCRYCSDFQCVICGFLYHYNICFPEHCELFSRRFKLGVHWHCRSVCMTNPTLDQQARDQHKTPHTFITYHPFLRDGRIVDSRSPKPRVIGCNLHPALAHTLAASASVPEHPAQGSWRLSLLPEQGVALGCGSNEASDFKRLEIQVVLRGASTDTIWTFTRVTNAR